MTEPTGVELIAAERTRQITELGWTPEHDAEHDSGELTDAAVAYVWGDPDLFPWAINPDEFHNRDPEGRVRHLVKAGALIAAEIDRTQRRV